MRPLPLAADASTAEPLADALARRTARAELVERAPSGSLKCTACAHRCVLDEDGRVGACGVRFRRDGELRAPFGYVARRYVRAVETNTIYHVRPGARALTFGMYGCDLRCPYCHNAHISQALRDELPGAERPVDVTPEALADEAAAAGCEVVCAAYNEPMISAEWTRAVFAAARARGMVTAAISDGHTTPEALAYMRPVTDVFRVDLKGYDNEQYKALGARFAPVMAAIREAKRLGYWVEVVTLVVPGFNDDVRALRALASELAAIDRDLPWHLNAFHPRYKLARLPRTHAMSLVDAAGAALGRGLRFVYVGNVPNEVRELSHTRCPACHEVLVERHDYRTLGRAIRDGRCPRCAAEVPGLWGPDAPAAAAGAPALDAARDAEMP